MFKKIVPEDIFLSALPDFEPDEAMRWQGRIDPKRKGRYVTGCDALDALVDLLHVNGYRTGAFFARRLGIRETDMNGFLRVVSGLSFAEWRNRYVLLMTKERLERTELTVDEIRKQMGFPNFGSFCRWFQEQTGRQPVEWRRGYREGTKRWKYHCDD